MKSTLRFLLPTLGLVVLFLAFTAAPVEAQRRQGRGPAGGPHAGLRVKSIKVYNRTNVTIRLAQRVVGQHRVYTGNLAKAVAHQRFARKQFQAGQFHRAIHHSRRARVLAFAAIQANQQSVPEDHQFDPGETAEPNTPPDSQLDADLAREEPNATYDDAAVVNEAAPDLQ